MEGRIWAESKKGIGSSFRFVLPLPMEEAKRKRSAAGNGGEAPAGKGTVLVVDDDPVVVELFRKMLTRRGYHTLEAGDGREAVAAWEKDGVDLILMDIQMPVMDGFHAVAEIREKEREGGGHVPVVAITARAMPEEEEAIRKAGFDDVVTKPVEFRRFFETIAECMGEQGTGNREQGTGVESR